MPAKSKRRRAEPPKTFAPYLKNGERLHYLRILNLPGSDLRRRLLLSFFRFRRLCVGCEIPWNGDAVDFEWSSKVHGNRCKFSDFCYLCVGVTWDLIESWVRNNPRFNAGKTREYARNIAKLVKEAQLQLFKIKDGCKRDYVASMLSNAEEFSGLLSEWAKQNDEH